MIVEILRGSKGSTDAEIQVLVDEYLKDRNLTDVCTDFKGTPLEGVVKKLAIDKSDKKPIPVYYYYSLNADGAGSEYIECDTTCLNAAQILTIPCKEFEGGWECLHFDSDIKNDLLEYSSKTLLFAERGVDPNVIPLNKLILLSGPPGTGKTSLCKALAQKLSIRRPHLHSHFVEINGHSLFSKYFSESGKLVQKTFERIIDIASDSSSLVFVLIDEVESLAHSRAAAAAGNEPSDAIRVVNALLTQLDRLKLLPNVLTLTTSNVENSIDSAFLDRADMCLYVGHPSPAAIAKILSSCIRELIKSNLLEEKQFDYPSEFSVIWLEICRAASGLSGRSLRKLPLLAYCDEQQPMSMADFLDALSKLIKARATKKELSQAHHMFQSISLV